MNAVPLSVSAPMTHWAVPKVGARGRLPEKVSTPSTYSVKSLPETVTARWYSTPSAIAVGVQTASPPAQEPPSVVLLSSASSCQLPLTMPR